MSGPGDIEGEVSGDEAAWRDLIARFDSPSDQARDTTPWPAREDLPADAAGFGPADRAASGAAAGDTARGDTALGDTAPGDPVPGDLTPGDLATSDPFSGQDVPGMH